MKLRQLHDRCISYMTVTQGKPPGLKFQLKSFKVSNPDFMKTAKHTLCPSACIMCACAPHSPAPQSTTGPPRRSPTPPPRARQRNLIAIDEAGRFARRTQPSQPHAPRAHTSLAADGCDRHDREARASTHDRRTNSTAAPDRAGIGERV
jgi:hypothetical protein